MPAQIMVTHLGKAAVQKLISDANATELLRIQESPPPDPSNPNAFLLICEETAGRPKAGAVEAMQKIADTDSRAVRAVEPKESAEPKPVAASKPVPAPVAKKPNV